MKKLTSEIKKLSFNQKSILIIMLLGLVTSIIFNILQYNQNANLRTQINVKSYGQSGGITANEVNFGATSRHMNGELGNQLEQMLNSIDARGVKISAIVMNGEPAIFAMEITGYLKKNGWDAEYQPTQIFGDTPIVGVQINPNLDENNYASILVGSAPEN